MPRPRQLTTQSKKELALETVMKFGKARNRLHAEEIWNCCTSHPTGKRARPSRHQEIVLGVAAAYLQLTEQSPTFGSIPGEHEPDCSSPQKVAEEIRYQLGLGWIGWLLLRTLILEIVKYLWSRTVSEEKD